MAAIACMDMAKLSVENLAVVYGSNDALAVMTKDAHTMLRIYLVALATSYSPERSFSALKRIKTYLRSTMTEAKLNHCGTLHIRKAMCKTINMQKAVDTFIIRSTASRNLFGATQQTSKYWTEHDYCISHSIIRLSQSIIRLGQLIIRLGQLIIRLGQLIIRLGQSIIRLGQSIINRIYSPLFG